MHFSKRKHLYIKFDYKIEMISIGEISLLKVNTGDMSEMPLTKQLPTNDFPSAIGRAKLPNIEQLHNMPSEARRTASQAVPNSLERILTGVKTEGAHFINLNNFINAICRYIGKILNL